MEICWKIPNYISSGPISSPHISLDLIFLTAAAAIFSPSLDWFGFDVAGRDFRFYLPLLGLVGEDDGGIDVKICRRRIWTEKDLHKIIFNSIFFMFLYDIGIWIL
ncbi:uncharacterized protein LOC122010823 [Zingiber officinale]|uniref:uncharacterized protein LOC122010823 n=1 Tax=Zingiber officinale TaxID=94328 RepID=UPI001C4C69CC|nr:uncharacterized protein LOC122010823 [Zingiber officinale]